MKSNRTHNIHGSISAFENMERKELLDQLTELRNDYDKLKQHVFKVKIDKTNSQGTARQVALTFYYMRNSDFISKQSGTNTVDAEFIHFLTGKDTDSIRKNLKDPKKIKRNESTGRATKELIDDLLLIRGQFEKILFSKGIEKINKDLEALRGDQASF